MSDPDERHPSSRFEYLFVSGCSRSGTSALVRLLNADPRLAIGQERFKFLRGEIEPDHFRPEHFLRPIPEETNVMGKRLYAAMRAKFEQGGVVYVGDKVMSSSPRRQLHKVLSRFQRSRLIFMYRDLEAVADSYERRAGDPGDRNWPRSKNHVAAVRDWNRSLRNLRSATAGTEGVRFLILPYEEFYAGERRWLEAIHELLSLEPLPAVGAAFEEATRDWNARAATPARLGDDARELLAARRSDTLAAWADRLVESQRAGWS